MSEAGTYAGPKYGRATIDTARVQTMAATGLSNSSKPTSRLQLAISAAQQSAERLSEIESRLLHIIDRIGLTHPERPLEKSTLADSPSPPIQPSLIEQIMGAVNANNRIGQRLLNLIDALEAI
jgi:hypothetical protein